MVSLTGTRFGVKGTAFSVKDMRFGVKGTGFSPYIEPCKSRGL
jgi:hypothetical protein